MNRLHRNVSKRKTTALAGAVMLGAVAILAGAGCQRHVNQPAADAIIPPPPGDEAMLHRDWEPASAMYANTSVVAGNTGFMFMPAWDRPAWLYPVLDTPIFLANVVLMPYSFFMTPPWEAVEYRAATVPPSPTAMPPLPPEPPRDEQRTSDLAQPTAPPSPEAAPPGAQPSGAQPTDVAPMVPFPTSPSERQAQPTKETSPTLPRPNPNPPVPAAPTGHITSTAEPATRPSSPPSTGLSTRPSTRLIIPSTNPTLPATQPSRSLNK